MGAFTQKIKPYVLPIALVLGALFHNLCGQIAFLTPYIVFTILLLTFSAVKITKLRLSWLDMWLALFQMTVSIGGYYLLVTLGVNYIIAQGLLIGVLCPVAASVAVISCMMGADRRTVTTYTIVGNLMVAVVAPLYFTIVTHAGNNGAQEVTFFASFWMILKKIGPTIGFPFFIILLLQKFLPKVNNAMARYKGASFYLWACALFINLGQTIDFIFLNGEGNWHVIVWLGLLALLFCAIQFGFGKWLGHRYGDTIAGGQLLGQKNSSMGIWMATTFLNPLSSVFSAFYSVFQNVFNSWQLWYYGRKASSDK